MTTKQPTNGALPPTWIQFFAFQEKLQELRRQRARADAHRDFVLVRQLRRNLARFGCFSSSGG